MSVKIGELEAPSGFLLLLDAGLSVYWDAPGEGVDLAIEGPDAERAGRTFDRQWDPGYLFDIPRPDEMRELFAKHCREAGLEASLREVARVPHRERARRVRPAGIAQYEGMWSVVVDGLPRDRTFEVRGELLEGEFAGRWRRVTVEVEPSVEVASEDRVDGVMVDHGQLLLCDLEAFGQFCGGRTRDGLADYVLWGPDAARVAAELGAAALEDGEFGWLDRGDAKIRRLGDLVEERRSAGVRVNRDYRPHCRLEELNGQIRSSEERCGTVALDGARAVGMDNRWGDGIFPVLIQRGATGQVVRVVVDLGNEKRQQLMRDVRLQASPALVTRPVLEGEPIRFGEHTPDGWFWSAGTEEQEQMEEDDFVVEVCLRDVLRMAPGVRGWLRHPEGTVVERVEDGEEFVLAEE